MLPKRPYYAVIFTSRLRDDADDEYAKTAAAMAQLASTMPGYLGFESARESGLGIAVSYWESLESIAAWRDNVDHRLARERGRRDWYAHFDLRIAKVDRQYSWSYKANDIPARASNPSGNED
ncbi:MAG: antibiotic biosynthesis monooxygenase [Gammaproteobacteria bacterium]|jgi:heme-degrading monooxygenase HmoA